VGHSSRSLISMAFQISVSHLSQRSDEALCVGRYPLSRSKQTSTGSAPMSAIDPKQTSAQRPSDVRCNRGAIASLPQCGLADGPVMPGAVTLPLTARNSELNVDPYRTTVVVQTSSHFFSDGAPNVRRKRSEGLPRRTTAPLERTIVGIE
jgi:hypothetical protein